MKLNLIRTSVISYLLTIATLTVKAQVDTVLVRAINEQIIPIKTSPADTNFADLQALKPFIKDKQVFSLGEATHGTHDFFAFKHRMLQFLVKEMGVKTFVIEADFAGTQIMNDYVLYGKGSVQSGLEGMGMGVWMVAEVVDMANWMKTYNSTQSAENKVAFWGCDMQWGTSAMSYIKQHLEPRGKFTTVMQDGFTAVNKYFVLITKADERKLSKAIKAISEAGFENKDTSATSLYKHYIRVLEQYAEYLDARSALFPTKQTDVRDKYMAENCLWIYNHTGRKKMMIWAHNGHINKTAGNYRLKPVGMHLANVLKQDLYTMGFDFYDGTIRTFSAAANKPVVAEMPHPKQASTGFVFSQCKHPNFILDLKSASANPILNRFINSENPTAEYGAGYNPATPPQYKMYKLSETFDAIIFIRNTSAAKAINN